MSDSVIVATISAISAVLCAAIGAYGVIIAAKVKGSKPSPSGRVLRVRTVILVALFAAVIGSALGIWVGKLITGNGSEIIVDDFSYNDTVEFQTVWETGITSPNGDTKVAIDTKTFAPETSDHQSLRIETNIPCLIGEERYQQIQWYWKASQNWQDSDVLELWVKGEPTIGTPGGEFSILLFEDDGEVWQSTRWFSSKNDWTKIKISLVGNGIGNPWEHDKDFVIPEWERSEAQNQRLDINKIQGMAIKSLTTTEWACGTEPNADGKRYPELAIWVDQIVRR